MEQELTTLIQKARQGDKDAFIQLVTRYKGVVFRQAYAMLNDHMEAEDVSQEAFLKVYASLRTLETDYAFASWLTRIVSRLCYDRLQKKKRNHVVFTDEWEEHLPSSNEVMERTQMQLSIEEALQKLSAEHRTVIVLRDVQGFSYDEIADVLQVPVGTIKSRIHTARLALRNELRKEERGNEP
ncbi:sigma-70 family RNA polymerase sigma factor [Aneurinibacillus sp. BA2021]|nr:sigma-70 family RNA polymerase sigma factor [Aneurinibacillus sp. BA2021]